MGEVDKMIKPDEERQSRLSQRGRWRDQRNKNRRRKRERGRVCDAMRGRAMETVSDRKRVRWTICRFTWTL